MSIIICYKCDKRVDTDYEESFEYDNVESSCYELICINCKEEIDEL